MEILIALHRQNLPPVQPESIEKPASAPLKDPVYPSVAFCLAGELVNAQDPALQRPTPIGISLRSGKAQVNDEVPAIPVPRTSVGQVFRMQQQNSHTAFIHEYLGMVSV